VTPKEFEWEYENIRIQYEEAIRPLREEMNIKLEALRRKYAASTKKESGK
jgi:transcription initiation factor IIE alpha subunit